MTYSANPPPPPKWWWWGSKQEVKGNLKAPATHRPTPHPPLPGCSVALCPGSCPGSGAVMGRVTLCVWPLACMLDVVIISAPCPPGRRSPKQEELWRGSEPGEQLCRLEAAGAPTVHWEHRCTGSPGGTTVFYTDSLHNLIIQGWTAGPSQVTGYTVWCTGDVHGNKLTI